MIRLLLTFILIISSNPSCESKPQSVEGNIKSITIQVKKDGQPVQLNLQQVPVTMPLADGKACKGELILLHEPRSGLFWWTYQALEPGQPGEGLASFQASSIIGITDWKIVVFTFSRPFVWVRESTEHYSTIDEGRISVLTMLKAKSKEIESGSVEWFRGINVTKALGHDFLNLKGSASPFPEPKLRGVTRKDGQWRLTLDGPNKDSAELVLSEDYQVVSAVRSPGGGF